MATISVPHIPEELIGKIVIFLPLKDVSNCMLVCKHWHELLSSGLFWKNYVQKNFDISDEEFPTGHLQVWQDPDFAYYWDDNEDKSNIYVFSEPPRRWKCGIVHPANFTIESHKDIKYKDFLRAVRILLRIQEAATELELDCGAYGNESDGEVEVCLIPWNKDSLPRAEDIINFFHFNPEMCEDPSTESEVPSDDEDCDDELVSWNTLRSFSDDKQKAKTFFNWFKKTFTPFVRILIGCDKMNPVPFFILAQLSPGWVGGVLTSLTLT